MRIRPGHPPDGSPPPELNVRKLLERVKNIELGKLQPETAAGIEGKVQPEQEQNGLTKDELKDVLDKTLEVVDLLAPRRHLEYEVVEEADIVQVHVVNTDDGSIVRKIPSDAIVKLVEQIHKILADRFEIEA
ncbi:MAG: flagellar protein FlaG [Fretibacterium sp.]|nr:flagellar protein FlaG [Fretibacterium sp.]